MALTSSQHPLLLIKKSPFIYSSSIDELTLKLFTAAYRHLLQKTTLGNNRSRWLHCFRAFQNEEIMTEATIQEVSTPAIQGVVNTILTLPSS